MIEKLKIVTATVVIVGIVVSFLDRWYAPHALLLESSPNRPWWLAWLVWVLTSVQPFCTSCSTCPSPKSRFTWLTTGGASATGQGTPRNPR